MTKTWSIQDAKANFSELLKEAEKEPQVITRHGKTVGIVRHPSQDLQTEVQSTVLELLRGNHTFTPPVCENWDDDWLERPELTLRPAPFEDDS